MNTIPGMSDSYQQLLAAPIRHLEQRKAQGARFVAVSRETLAALAAPCVRESNTTAPAPIRSPVPPVPAELFSESSSPPAAPSSAVSLPTSHLPASAPRDRQAREAAMAELQARALVCQKCPNLAASRKNVVFGVGDVESPLMFVGEAPGADEDEQGEPFVGKAGQLLNKIIQTMGFTRRTVYIANILKCR